MRISSVNTTGKVGFKNEGYWGMDVKQQKYTGSFWVKGAYSDVFTASLQSNTTGEVFGFVEIPSKSVVREWTEHAFELVPEKNAPDSNNSFAITFDSSCTGNGTLDFNLISLFPPTYKDRKNGLRVDIAEALADLNPVSDFTPSFEMSHTNDHSTFFVSPVATCLKATRMQHGGTGGTLLVRSRIARASQVCGVTSRLMVSASWSTWSGLKIWVLRLVRKDLEITLRLTNSFIVVGVYAGLSLNGDVTSQEDLQYFIDVALDEIEFITASSNSTWGARRAELGHPEPFELNYVEIGNEDWLAGFPDGWNSYLDYRFSMFHDAIKAVYPDMQIISSAASSDPSGDQEGGASPRFQQLPPGAIGDYHPYREPDELVEEFDRFDNEYGHIIGEVAATHPNGGIKWEGDLQPYPWWQGAVGEAVSLLGYERNSNRIPGTFYAPVLKNENRFQWPITLIQYTADPNMTTRAVTWYCWSLFAHHPITHTLPTYSNDSYGPLYWAAGKDEERNNAHVWKCAVYNTTNSSNVPVSVHFQGIKAGAKANLTYLTNAGEDGYAFNDPRTGVNIVNTTNIILTAGPGGAFKFSLPELSVAVLDTELSKTNSTAPPPPYGY